MCGRTIESPYWLDTVDRPDLTSAPLPSKADVIVIGGGFTGLSAALALAKRGVDVVVLEAERVAWGASSRNGGMVLSGLKRSADWLLGRFGLDTARALFARSLAAIDCVERIAREESIDCDFARCGHLEAASKERHLDHLRRTADLLGERFDHRVSVLNRDALLHELSSASYAGGVVDDTSAAVNPARFAVGLALAAVKRGARIVEGAAVRSVERTSARGEHGFTASTERGAVRAPSILVATGAYTTSVFPQLRARIVRVGSYVIATEPLPAELAAALIPRRRMIFDTNNFLHYYRLTRDSRMVFGGRAAFAPADDRTTRESAAILRRDMTRVFPALKEAHIDYAWGGTLDMTFDLLPHAGVIDGMHYALGYAGHGVAMATYAGERIAEAIARPGSAGDPLGCGPLSDPPPGLSGAHPWFLPLAGAWYRFLDWAS